jgi:hypothetical protein
MSGVTAKRVSKENRKESAKRSLQREESSRLERFMTEITHYKGGKTVQSTTSSPFINKTMTPKIKAVRLRCPLGFSPTTSSDKDQKSKRWDMSPVLNSYQQRVKTFDPANQESQFGLKSGLTEAKRGRSSHKEASALTKKRDIKLKKQPKSKKQSKLELITQKTSSKVIQNKENIAPNLYSGFENGTQSLMNKLPLSGSNETSSYQMFGKFLKSMDLRPLSLGNISSNNSPLENRLWVPIPQISVSDSQYRLLMSSASLITQIRTAFEQEIDCYDLIRDYVDQSQLADFKSLNFLLSSSTHPFYCQALFSLKIERWAIMMLFFFRFSSKLSQIRMKHILKDLLDESIESITCILYFLRKSVGDTKRIDHLKMSHSKACSNANFHQMTETEAETLLKSNNQKMQDKVLVGYTLMT